MNRYSRERQLEILVSYFRSHETPEPEHQIGVEFEHFLVDADTLETRDYYSPGGGRWLLEELARGYGWSPDYEGENILGLSKNGATVTLEPGGQIEFSTAPRRTLAEVHREYDTFLAEIVPAADEVNGRLSCLGYQPKTPVDRIRMIPRKKYRVMADYFASRGRYAHNMMKGTAATQVTLDYTDETEFREMMQAAHLVSPALSLLFDNTCSFEGSRYSGHTLRTDIWENCDGSRCGIIPGVLSPRFGYAEYGSYILDIEPIVLYRNGSIEATGNATFANLFDPEAPRIDIDQVLIMVFPEIRLKKFLEFRSVDSQPYRHLGTFLYTLNRILADPGIRKGVLEYCRSVDEAALLACRRSSVRRGFDTPFAGTSLREFTAHLVDMLGRTAVNGSRFCVSGLEKIFRRKLEGPPLTEEEILERSLITPGMLSRSTICSGQEEYV